MEALAAEAAEVGKYRIYLSMTTKFTKLGPLSWVYSTIISTNFGAKLSMRCSLIICPF